MYTRISSLYIDKSKLMEIPTTHTHKCKHSIPIHNLLFGIPCIRVLCVYTLIVDSNFEITLIKWQALIIKLWYNTKIVAWEFNVYMLRPCTISPPPPTAIIKSIISLKSYFLTLVNFRLSYENLLWWTISHSPFTRSIYLKWKWRQRQRRLRPHCRYLLHQW